MISRFNQLDPDLPRTYMEERQNESTDGKRLVDFQCENALSGPMETYYLRRWLELTKSIFPLNDFRVRMSLSG